MTEQRHIHENYRRTARFLGAPVADIQRYQQLVTLIGPRTLFRTQEMAHALWNVGLNQLRRERHLLPTDLDQYCADVWLYLKQRPPNPKGFLNDAAEFGTLRQAITEAFAQ